MICGATVEDPFFYDPTVGSDLRPHKKGVLTISWVYPKGRNFCFSNIDSWVIILRRVQYIHIACSIIFASSSSRNSPCMRPWT